MNKCENMMARNSIITNAKLYVKDFFSNDCSGHDYWHTIRVYNLASEIAEKENADIFIVQLASLLHDVDDIKLSPDTYADKRNAVSFMKKHGLDEHTIFLVCNIIDEVSYLGNESVVPRSIEGKCVQDADRLDAMGAVGIARAFAYGGSHHRMLHDPGTEPQKNMSKKEYRNCTSTTVNHFYEKLFHLKGLMNTDSAKEKAEHRDRIMHEYIKEFLAEWNGRR